MTNRSAARSEGLSPEQRRERLEQEDMPEDVRTALFDELERGEERRPDADNMARAMNLLSIKQENELYEQTAYI